MSQRRKFDKEFKMKAVELLNSSGKTITEISDNLGISSTNLGKWKKEFENSKENAFPGNGNPRDKEIADLKKRNAILEMERDILKKAIAIFSEQKK
jgi:transposase